MVHIFICWARHFTHLCTIVVHVLTCGVGKPSVANCARPHQHAHGAQLQRTLSGYRQALRCASANTFTHFSRRQETTVW